MIPLLLFLSSVQASESPAKQDVEARLSNSKCASSLTKMIQLWSAKNEWQMQISDNPNTVIFNSPTQQLGVWVQVQFQGENRTSLVRSSPESTSILSWDGNCALTSELKEHPLDQNAMRSSFTDESLARLLQKNKYGVIYVWSPHMTYSMAGIDTITQVAHKLNVPLEIIRDPNASMLSVSQAVKDWKLSNGFLRRLESMELMNRGALNHYPVIAIYSEGAVKTVIPGLKTENQYAEEIQNQIRR